MKHVGYQHTIWILNPDPLGAAPRRRANMNLDFKVRHWSIRMGYIVCVTVRHMPNLEV